MASLNMKMVMYMFGKIPCKLDIMVYNWDTVWPDALTDSILNLAHGDQFSGLMIQLVR